MPILSVFNRVPKIPLAAVAVARLFQPTYVRA
jgi:hypothetical protein